jgi:hypothetical protein
MDNVQASSVDASASLACPSGRWSADELMRLEGAINQLGGSARHAELAAIVRFRTAAQVAAKVKDLVTSGKLRRIGPTTFAIIH